jgi:glutamate-1-semialdehyde 2,1-aminomutase
MSSFSSSAAYSLKPPNMFIKGVGSLMAIHFAGPQKLILPGLFYHHMLRQGIYLAQRGFIALSIEINDHHVDKFVEALNEFCEAWLELLR